MKSKQKLTMQPGREYDNGRVGVRYNARAV